MEQKHISDRSLIRGDSASSSPAAKYRSGYFQLHLGAPSHRKRIITEEFGLFCTGLGIRYESSGCCYSFFGRSFGYSKKLFQK